MIRKAADRDLERIMQIEEICFSSRWTKEMFLYELHENEFGHFYVLEENQKIAGFIDFWITFECCTSFFSEKRVQPLSDGFYDCIGRAGTV